MKEHDELMKALEAWNYAGVQRDWSDEDDALLRAYQAYRNAPKQLVLERVDQGEIKVHRQFIMVNGDDISIQTKRSKNDYLYMGQCYRIPETE